MRGVLIAAIVLAAFLGSAPSFAQTTGAPATSASPAPSVTPSPTPTPVPPWSVSGFQDVTYTTSLVSNGTFLFTNGGSTRVFDAITGNNTKLPTYTRFVPNSFNINIKKNAPQGIGGQLEETIGSDANVIASYGGAAGTYTDVTQAYIFLATGQFTINVGKFETLAGAEVIESPSDWEISRSILFGYAVPFTHTGVRAVWVPSGKISLTAGANYGWDQLVSTNGLSTLEAAVAYNPSSYLAFNVNYYNGKEPSPLTPYPTGGTIAPRPGSTAFYPSYPPAGITGTIYGTRGLVDVVAKWTPSSALNFALNYDTAQQNNSQAFDSLGNTLVNPSTGFPTLQTVKWNGLAGYANWNVNSHFTASGRLEYLNDNNGNRTGFAQTWSEGTLTLQYVPGVANWKVRGELRQDWVNQPTFARYTSPIGTAAKNNTSLGFEAIYSWP
ncbi:MAG: outer membrane beta-barrel protein [Candidatus Eremiobacteraeota bacterium]|nr:outer membrane beta-barrel protein [Candidatus Eremiobacteraeota bacterium]